MAKKNAARNPNVTYVLNMATFKGREYEKNYIPFEGVHLKFGVNSNWPVWGRYFLPEGVVIDGCESLLLTDEEVKVKRFRYKLYNKHSDAVCAAMEESEYRGALWSRLSEKTGEDFLCNFNDGYAEDFIDNRDCKETLFGFLHVVDDETFAAIINELKA